ncbi:Peptidase M20, dimerization domain containing protein [Trema orientale]|uniref:Peptidase M20, dimerization domain containing protein n=1 Tax=Trema orientale TaxID=63057 RepID=A0A2P5DQT0_TREOI|nr:Peptidase M20, dimerization domain containing protein [Trema orientale]
MLDAGALENINAIFGLHVNPKLPIGEVACRSGPILAGSGSFEAVISGKGGHAALPQHSLDPILATSNVIISLQHLVSREADPLDSQVVTIAKFQGGGAFNVVPDSVTICGTFRAFSKESFIRLRHRIEQAIVQRCKASVSFLENEKPFFPPTVNHEDLHAYFKRRQNLDTSFLLGMENNTLGKSELVHSPYFHINEEAFPYGAALLASLATSYLSEFQPEEEGIIEETRFLKIENTKPESLEVHLVSSHFSNRFEMKDWFDVTVLLLFRFRCVKCESDPVSAKHVSEQVPFTTTQNAELGVVHYDVEFIHNNLRKKEVSSVEESELGWVLEHDLERLKEKVESKHHAILDNKGSSTCESRYNEVQIVKAPPAALDNLIVND